VDGVTAIALADHDVQPTGPDVAIDDEEAVTAHSTAWPPEGWASGWLINPRTLGGLRSAAPKTASSSWAVPPLGALIARPVWLDDDVPDGVLRPVHVRRTPPAVPADIPADDHQALYERYVAWRCQDAASPGWLASRQTLEDAASRLGAELAVRLDGPARTLFGLPVGVDDTIPDGVFRPVDTFRRTP
jgi:hypothetical protein